VIQPNVTHAPCDLNQQRTRAQARKARVARAVAWRSGRRSLLERLLRRRGPALDLTAEDLRPSPSEDVNHSLLF
jgi:hypothetical protein